jgi:hypothetical protein
MSIGVLCLLVDLEDDEFLIYPLSRKIFESQTFFENNLAVLLNIMKLPHNEQ